MTHDNDKILADLTTWMDERGISGTRAAMITISLAVGLLEERYPFLAGAIDLLMRGAQHLAEERAAESEGRPQGG